MDKKFLVDFMLGKLAKWLRFLGYDAVYKSITNMTDLERYLDRGYIFLTRRSDWLKNKKLPKDMFYFVRSNKTQEQMREIIRHFNLKLDKNYIFSRCSCCNTILIEKNKEEAIPHVPEYIGKIHNRFKFCPICKRFYWPGTHRERMEAWLKACFTEGHRP